MSHLPQRDPVAIARAARRIERLLVPYHRARVLGVDRIPPGPAIYVGNHNGGFYTGDTYLFGAAVFRARGLADTPWTMTHELGIALLGRWLRPLGAVSADPATAAALLARGDKVLAYPGGDADGARSWTERRRVVFDGRVGHARLAVACGVPVIPVAAAGAHNTAIVLYDGAAVARLLRTRRWLRLTRWPLLLSMPWGLTFLPAVPHLPFPARITIAVGEPLRFDRSGPAAAADSGYVTACARQAEAAVQALLLDLHEPL
ncbi:1-acyl-sn-glycerol-3-phosphate acyltransferase [Micromonospora phytophila]|uniref:1-acyl-sn-glycerol-3-phosphate acyltransferase n=1 Tax=Micromonospora phytophila TaxID=709888 RepID=UPI002030374F|nr:1-acyl-sn-glycerol-3-phosphate acyltransferase [Micromonospora phytophila]MCM0677949.1 1-acyl-sn-glycerol-3-phosphate acyltransferase [Micromonospora phytophila]